MITLDDFLRIYKKEFNREPDDDQLAAIRAESDKALFIVAGPGSGKTTCLTLRILKLVLVDGISPRGILATTFTKKAAAELRSRVLGWGFRLIEAIQQDARIAKAARERIARVDINQVVTGTIDSICEEILRDHREPGVLPPVLADDFVSKTLLLRAGLFEKRRDLDTDLDGFLKTIQGSTGWGWNVGAKVNLVQGIWDRRFQDQVDWARFVSGGPRDEKKPRQLLGEIAAAYQQALTEHGMIDFALLEQNVLERLQANQLEEFTQPLQVVLVDEYQDTNLMQERIYFELAQHCHGALTVVGDDDQSLYRFRGATVELFSEFSERYKQSFGRRPQTVFLKTNYRSTKAVVKLVNNFVGLDQGYQGVRVRSKPRIESSPKAPEGLPVLGLFRDDLDTLAGDLAQFIHKVFRGRGFTLPGGQQIKRHSEGGDVGDCALLCSSPAEYSSGDNERLPYKIREQLQPLGIQVFNPRGQDLTRIPVIARFGGLLLECLDSGGAIESQMSGLSDNITNTFALWRQAAVDFSGAPTAPRGLLDYAMGWVDRSPGRTGWMWPTHVPVLELIYGLLHFFPELHDDPEGQIYLEVFTRQASAAEQVGKFSGRIVTDPDNPGLSQASVKELLRDFLGPIAAGAVDVNEDLLEAFPRDRLSILSIHQAKGLEFPLTIVDVGADFKSNHPAHAFKRFPTKGSPAHTLEDLLRPYTDLGVPARSSVDRAFDDLYRQFFVAYSRPQEVLLLVGHRKTLPGGIRNVATGWSRADTSKWTGANAPFIQI